ncbi:solute carrier organic anion transporter family member 5A1-like [Pomacea canaliculata]|uniref:solute carrier organic anion transporter family member 5A1-like n=1 Tax=Pomacea canaliculata TaxID=400727 RepID=UPI000D73818D|nr:solute carrier organic anion transporter family member 5A1-like [Pomacea canaliculata]
MIGDKDMKQPHKDSFGWGPIVPKFLKGCKRLSCLAICFIFCSFLNGINLGALSVALTTLEKRYGFSSKVTGLVSAAANIGSVTTIIFLAPLGYQSHRPRMLACGAVVTAVSCLLRIMPHLLDGPYWLPDTIERMRSQHPLCQTSGNSTSCSKLHSSDTFANTALVFLLLGQLAGGAGFSQIISFAPGIFTDHLADKKSGHAYIAASNVLGAVGISAGFLFGSVCLTIFVDIRTTIYIDYSNQEWIGAWWLMFAFTGTFLLIFAIILFAFPARVYDGFARKNLLDEERDSLKDSAGSTSSTSSSTRVQKRGGNCKNFLKKIKTFPGSLVKLVKNPAFNLFNICTWSELFFMSGLCAFGPKVFEKDFDISSADAGLVMGTIVASGAVGGILGGGFVISKMSANPRALARTCAICSLVAAACFLRLLLPLRRDQGGGHPHVLQSHVLPKRQQ